MLKNEDILDEKDKILHTVSKEVTFPMEESDKKAINDIIEYLTIIFDRFSRVNYVICQNPIY